MNNDIVLEVNNVSKKYCRNLKRSMFYGSFDILKDAFNLSTKPEILRKDEFWSVKDISFNLKRGECLGIIGPNGAGKSTLLKMLNGIIKPDMGEIRYKGSMGALIEVGAGFQPVLSGRENIYINGSILGLSNSEIKSKFDQIVDFSELEEFIDTPVKNYSSGMKVRLGFSIAAHLHPDILLVDEVLAVGDLAFNAKCREKISELINNGTSIVFISHNMHQVSNLCYSTIVLNHGQLVNHGNTSESIDLYKKMCCMKSPKETGGSKVKIQSVQLLDNNNEQIKTISSNSDLHIKIAFENPIYTHLVFAVIIKNSSNTPVVTIRNDYSNTSLSCLDKKTIILHINKLNLLPDTFYIDVALLEENGFVLCHRIDNALSFQISGGNKVSGIVDLEHRWEICQ